MDENDERTSLVRSNGTQNGATLYNSNTNGYNTGNWSQRANGNHQPRTPGQDGLGRRDPRTLLSQVQQGLGFFQEWAANVLHGKEDSGVVNWVQSTRVARTFIMIINVLLTISAFVLIGVETMEMVVREPILDHLLPESNLTLMAAGLLVVAGAFGFAVAFNLLVEEDSSSKSDNGDDHRGGGYGRDGEPGPQAPLPSHPTTSMQQTTQSPRLMFTKASTFQLNGYAVFLAVVIAVFVFSIAQRSSHLSSTMDRELFDAWGAAYKMKGDRALIRDFQLRHQCCGYGTVIDRSYPPFKQGNHDPEDTKNLPCWENPKFKFEIPCQSALAKDYWRWQNGIQHLLLVQVTMLLPLLLLVMGLSAIGLSKLKKRKQGLEDTEAQAAEARPAVPVAVGRTTYANEQPRLGYEPHHETAETPLLFQATGEPMRVTSEVPVEQGSEVWT